MSTIGDRFSRDSGHANFNFGFCFGFGFSRLHNKVGQILRMTLPFSQRLLANRFRFQTSAAIRLSWELVDWSHDGLGMGMGMGMAMVIFQLPHPA